MESKIEIRPANGPVDFSIRPPGSKSISNRALICAALAAGKSTLSEILVSDDTRVMLDSLQKLGIAVTLDEPNCSATIFGCGGQLPNPTAELFVDNSGTTIRFLTGMLGLHGGKFRLSGAPRMHERPIGPLAEALNQLGAKITTQSDGGCPPVAIDSARIAEGTCKVAGDISSQYASGLMLASPLAAGNFQIQLLPPIVSKPYLLMTQQVMKQFGVESSISLAEEPTCFSLVAGQTYQPLDYAIEPDASAASYFWATAAICGGNATVIGLNKDSLQGDVGFAHCLEQMGCNVKWESDRITVSGKARRGIDIDMADISDTVQTLAAVALFVSGPTRVRGVAHNRVKETDRIGNLAIELRKLGAIVNEHEDGLTIAPGKLQSAEIETYNDHRMAMSLSLPGLVQAGVAIKDPGCTSKTYPNFFEDLDKAVNNQ